MGKNQTKYVPKSRRNPDITKKKQLKKERKLLKKQQKLEKKGKKYIDKDTLDLQFVCDCSENMQSWINTIKSSLLQIVEFIRE